MFVLLLLEILESFSSHTSPFRQTRIFQIIQLIVGEGLERRRTQPPRRRAPENWLTKPILQRFLYAADLDRNSSHAERHFPKNKRVRESIALAHSQKKTPYMVMTAQIALSSYRVSKIFSIKSPYMLLTADFAFSSYPTPKTFLFPDHGPYLLMSAQIAKSSYRPKQYFRYAAILRCDNSRWPNMFLHGACHSFPFLISLYSSLLFVTARS